MDASFKAIEEIVLKNVNVAANQLGMAPLSRFGELFQADDIIFRTFKEMDHYQLRANGNYFGILKGSEGIEPEWPDVKGPRIFAYLKNFKTLPSLLKVLKINRLPTLIYPDYIPTEIKEAFSCETLRFVDQPLNIDRICETAYIAICNASHGTCNELLLGGLPMLLLPLNGEQHMV